MINVYVGWDSREIDAYNVCCSSIKRYTSNNFEYKIIPIIKDELQRDGMYSRDNDALASTEFTYTRFLVPVLQGYSGYAIFCDCDFLWLEGIDTFLNEINISEQKAVYVCKHDYTPRQNIKMDNILQTTYPRKNWSSLILWNCNHPKNSLLTKELIHNASGAYLHRFQWLDDSDIGEINIQWNWLVDEYNVSQHGSPRALHYTNGGPWFENCKNCSYASLWNEENSRRLV